MIDWIPLPYYATIFFIAILFITLFMALKLQTQGLQFKITGKINPLPSVILFTVVTLYIGLRPLSGRYFGDMGMYYHRFQLYASGIDVTFNRDVLWQLFEKISSSLMSSTMFFLLCAFLYVFPLYKAAINLLKSNRFLLFLMLLASFSFWTYGTNGIRNGIATSIFLMGLSFTHKKILKYALLGLSVFIHGSMIIPLTAYGITLLTKKTTHFIFAWLLCIVFSLIFGSAIGNYVTSLGIGGSRLQYLTMESEATFRYTGFRWDFLIYSASAIYAGYFFVIKKGFKDKFYIQLLNIYIIANAFWVLVIRAAYTNRFAYLSWFMMAVVIFYPFLNQRFFKNQSKALSYTMLLYVFFTFFMNVVIYRYG